MLKYEKSPISIEEAYKLPMSMRVIPWFENYGDQKLRLNYELNENSDNRGLRILTYKIVLFLKKHYLYRNLKLFIIISFNNLF